MATRTVALDEEIASPKQEERRELQRSSEATRAAPPTYLGVRRDLERPQCQGAQRTPADLLGSSRGRSEARRESPAGVGM